jgi:hypothetical protein
LKVSKLTSELELSATARDVFKEIQRAAVVGAALDGLRGLEELREQTPHAGPQIDAGLHDLLPRLTELAARGDGKGLAAELAALKLRAQAGAVLPKPYTPTPPRPSAFGPSPQPGPMAGRYPWLDQSSGLPR